MRLLIKNGRVIDPLNNLDEVCDILIEDSNIARVAKDIKVGAEQAIDANGKIVLPGLVDMHVHLREPGREDKETVETGTMSALAGGVTSLLAIPNTQPPIDSVENARLLTDIIRKTAKANVFIAGTITRGRLGEELADISGLKKEGILAITDDGASVDPDELMLAALEAAKKEDIPVICHSEDKKLSGGGQVNRGFIATRMGLRGISCESEYKRIERDIALARESGARIHIAHVSCKESVELIAQAKKKGIRVTCEAAPHHFTFSEEDLKDYDTNFKMNPPLRSKEDVAAIRQGLKDGIIDAIASDHAPHTENEKEIEFERAEFGVIGLETALAVAATELVNTGILSWSDLAKKMSSVPAQILGLKKGSLGAGSVADITIFAPGKEWVVRKEGIISRSKNSAFLGKTLKGMVEYTILAGKVAYKI
ncbi:MAG: dihydroorotase [Candidatus Omnitrophica bacterium]|nr:dihydroorotase [Candidatus Omnitrophota bacterium]